MAYTFELYDGSTTLDLTDETDYDLTSVEFVDERQEPFAGNELRSLKFLPHRVEVTLNILGESTSTLLTAERALTNMLRVTEDRQTKAQGTKVVLKYQLGGTDANDISQRVLSGSLVMPDGRDSVLKQKTIDQNIVTNARLSLLLEPMGRLADVAYAVRTLGNEQDTVINYADFEGLLNGFVTFDGVSGTISVPFDAAIDNIYDSGGIFEVLARPRSAGEVAGAKLYDRVAHNVNVQGLSNGFLKIQLQYSFSTSPGTWTTTNAVLPIDKFSRITIEYDADNAANVPVIKIDGVAQALSSTQPVGTRNSDAGDNLTIGNRTGDDRTWDGDLDDFRLWGGTRTEAEINDNLFIELVGNESNLAGYWPFNRLTGNSAIDATSNGNDGSLTNVVHAIADRHGTSGGRLELKIHDANNGGGTPWNGSNKMWIGKRSGERRTDTLFLQTPDSVVEVEDPSTGDNLTAVMATTGGVTASASGGASAHMKWENPATPTKFLTDGFINAAYAHYDIAAANLPLGRFRVLARFTTHVENGSTTNSTVDNEDMGVALGYVFGGKTVTPVEADAIMFDVGWTEDEFHTVDFGEIIIPPQGNPGGSATSPDLNLRIHGITNTESSEAVGYGATAGYIEISIDYVFLLPVDEGVVIIDSVGTNDRVLISNKEDVPGVWLLDGSDVVQQVATFNGGPFNLGPEDTRIYWLRDDTGDPTTIQAVLTPKYTPLIQGI